MIKTIEQATAVQERRVKAGKRGYAKAVRRFLMREHEPAAVKPRVISSAEFFKALDSLPVNWKHH